MSSNKRQKVDAGQGTQLLSAAALRRRLLERQASAPATPTRDDNGGGGSSRDIGSASEDNHARTPEQRKRKKGDASPVKKDSSRTAEQVLLGDFGAATTEDEIYGTPDTLEEPPKRKVLPLSSFKPNKDNLKTRADGVAVLRLPESERLVILGSYGIRIKAGETTISGASLYLSEAIHWIHAPHCHALPVLRCSENSVIEIHSHPSAYDLRNLERLSPIFGSLWNEADTEEIKRRSWQILSTSADGPKRAFLQELKSPAEWNKKIADLVKPSRDGCPVFLVCGPKGSGKSTFSRIMTNKLITRRDGTKARIWPGVAVLDIDPGQPEFSPPGVISLVLLDQPTLAPPFCHPTLDFGSVKRSHALASITPATDIEHYKACVTDLFKTYKTACSKYPLIINTPGWVQGSGLTLLTDLISEIHPTESIYMSEDGPQDTVESLKSAGRHSPFSTLPSQSIEYASRTALHLRHMQAMSYLHVDPCRDEGGQLQWNSAPLSSTPPLMASYSAEGGGITAILCYGYQPEPELLTEAINGTIVAIVTVEDNDVLLHGLRRSKDAADNTSNAGNTVRRTPEGLPYIHSGEPCNPETSQCLGLALVRGIEKSNQVIALSSPVRPDQLKNRRLVLVSGKFDLPTWAYTEDHYHRAFAKDGEDDGTEGLTTEGTSDAREHIPWVEKLHGSQKRAVGSKVWRVRRDLGRNNSVSGN